MPDDAVMRWYRTDTRRPFNGDILTLEFVFPLSGQGFFDKLCDLIYYNANCADYHFILDDHWTQVQTVMREPGRPRQSISRPTFDRYLNACFAAHLFDELAYQASGEICSQRTRKEIAERFGDMTRKEREYQAENRRRIAGESGGESPENEDTIQYNTKHYKTRRHKQSGRSFSAPSNGSRVGDALRLDQDAMRRLQTRGEAITREAVTAEILAMQVERNNGAHPEGDENEQG